MDQLEYTIWIVVVGTFKEDLTDARAKAMNTMASLFYLFIGPVSIGYH